MKRKLQIMVTEANWRIVETILKEANENFNCGNINYSDLLNEMITTSKIDLKTLQAKHTNLRKSLRSLASQKEIDFETAIKLLTDLKIKGAKKISKQNTISPEKC